MATMIGVYDVRRQARTRWEAASRAVPDLAVLAALAVGALTEAIARTAALGQGAQTGIVLALLALAGTVPLAVLGPAAAAVAVSAVSILSLTAFHAVTVGAVLATLLALYRLGRRPGRIRLIAAAAAAPFLLIALLGARPDSSEVAALAVLVAGLAPVAAWGGIARSAQSRAIEHDAVQAEVADARIEHTARGERARIARELHDVVAHHISMIAVQAETARLTTPGLSAAGTRRLQAIGDTARAGLTEMRRLLGVLRTDADAPVERAPQPGLAQLSDLIDQAREAAGGGCRLILRGRPRPLESGIELTAYRIVQEALTNARRHARGAAVDVELHYTENALHLRIRDNGPGGTDGAPGHGLLGMRERAGAVGGRLEAGPAVGGGFVVDADLPIQAKAGE